MFVFVNCDVGTTIFSLILRYVGFSKGQAFGLILTLTGGIAGSCTSFIIPGIIYIKMMPSTAPLFYPCVVMMIFGVAVLLIVPTVSILDIVHS